MNKSLQNDNFKRALSWREVGVSAFPLRFKSKKPIIKWSQYRDELPKPVELRQFFTKYNTNLGIICGEPSGLTVVDFDRADGYKEFISDIPLGIARIFEKSYKVKTPRGLHVYFWSEGTRSIKDTRRKIDLKGIGGYVVAPNSVHPSGEFYKDVGRFDISKIQRLPSVALESLFPSPKVDWDSKKISSFEREDDGVFPSPYSDIDDICERVSILRIAMNYTNMFPEKRGGHFWKGKCPLPSHNDKDPSFWVNTRTGLCGCFGNCELNGNATNVIGLYAKINGITYGEAIKILKDM